VPLGFDGSCFRLDHIVSVKNEKRDYDRENNAYIY
jgi:hypothetical protein